MEALTGPPVEDVAWVRLDEPSAVGSARRAAEQLARQLGGADPRELARAARWGEEAGFDEINLNVGCPSDRVQSGRFGACLMREPALVADCVRAMREAIFTALGIYLERENDSWLAEIDVPADADAGQWLDGIAAHRDLIDTDAIMAKELVADLDISILF